ncbi:nucleotide exchange factor GrpE [Patescibacteria group bacterium]|nr:nucleotide exchange factor GrpE [Patescibacteria group bacterium]
MKDKKKEAKFIPGIYQHYKGGKYQTLFIAYDKEKKQETVVYKEFDNEKYYTRSLKNFLDTVKIDKKKVNRFELLQTTPAETWEERYKRAIADYQNLLKQTAKEKTTYYKYALEDFILEILPVYDNLRMSIKSLNQEQADNPWVEGVKYVIKQFEQILENHGVKQIEVAGKPFDPQIMEAISDDNKKNSVDIEGICEKELKPGYKLHDKVIIPAKVIVK